MLIYNVKYFQQDVLDDWKFSKAFLENANQ